MTNSLSLMKHEQRLRALRRYKAANQYHEATRSENSVAVLELACERLKALDVDPSLLDEPVCDDATGAFDGLFGESVAVLNDLRLKRVST